MSESDSVAPLRIANRPNRALMSRFTLASASAFGAGISNNPSCMAAGHSSFVAVRYSGPHKLDHQLSYSGGPAERGSDEREAEAAHASVQSPGSPGGAQRRPY